MDSYISTPSLKIHQDKSYVQQKGLMSTYVGNQGG